MIDSLRLAASITIILFFIAQFCFIKSTHYFGPDKLYYKAPTFSIKNANVTFVGSKYTGYTQDRQNALVNLGKSIAVLCQADMINRKATNFSFDGVMNIAFNDYIDEVGSGQSAVTELLANNLYYYANDSRVNTAQGDLDVTGFFNIGIYGTAVINSLVTNFFSIPAINSGDSARNSPDNQFIGPFEAANRTVFEFLDTQVFNSFNAVIQLTQYFNWSLVGSLFEASSYGYDRQMDIITWTSYRVEPIFVCDYVVYGAQSYNDYNDNLLDKFCSCINYKDTIQVIILWMTTSIALTTITYLRTNCPTAQKWTFIIANDFQAPSNYSFDESAQMQYTLEIRSNGPWNFQQYIDECKDGASPAAKPVLTASITEYYRIAYNCSNVPEDERNLPQCPQSLVNRTEFCKCNGNEFSTDPYASKYFFTSDMISGFANALKLLQNNCTFLTEKGREFGGPNAKNYCAMNTFTPKDLAFALRFIDFIGYTGPIFFPDYILRRSIKSYFLYQNRTLTGELTPSGPTIYANLFHWIDNERPISRIVPQNPSLSYGVVAVFFAIGIAELIVCSILIVLYLLNFNDIIIKRNAPRVSLLMLIGITFIAMSQVIAAIYTDDALCTLTAYFYRAGICLLISGLIVKHYRIHRIFSNKLAVAINMPESTLVMYMAIATFIYVGIVTIFLCVFGIEAVVRTSSYDEFYQSVTCAIPNKTWGIIFIFLVQIPIVIAIFLNLYLAWLTHNIQSECSESRRLAAFSIILGASFIIFVPLSLTLGNTVDSAIIRAVIDGEYLTIGVVSALAILFIPKIWEIYSIKRKVKRERARE